MTQQLFNSSGVVYGKGKMIFICDKKFYKVPKHFVSCNSAFSDIIKVLFFCVFFYRCVFILLFIIRSLVPIWWKFPNINCLFQILYRLPFLALYFLMSFFIKSICFSTILKFFLLENKNFCRGYQIVTKNYLSFILNLNFQ